MVVATGVPKLNVEVVVAVGAPNENDEVVVVVGAPNVKVDVVVVVVDVGLVPKLKDIFFLLFAQQRVETIRLYNQAASFNKRVFTHRRVPLTGSRPKHLFYLLFI